MCDLELDRRDVEHRYGIDFGGHFADALRRMTPFVEDGLVTVTEDAIRIRHGGRLLLRNIAMCFDAYLDSMTKNKPVFSRTV
jgi:oxygen-independent coproporphyrinogen-3 oxidase